MFNLCFILLFYFISYYFNNISTNNTTVSYIDTDTEGPVITSLSPDKCEQFIVSKPDIKINYKDENGIDISSVRLFVNSVSMLSTVISYSIGYLYFLNNPSFCVK